MSKLIKQMLKKKQRSNFSTIEWELRNYKQTKKELELMREEVIMGRKHSETPAERHRISDPTAAKAIQLTTSTALIETERRIAAIEYALEVLEKTEDPSKLKLIEYLYLNPTPRYSDVQIRQKVHIGTTTFYKWRNEFVWLIANRLGWDAGQPEAGGRGGENETA